MTSAGTAVVLGTDTAEPSVRNPLPSDSTVSDGRSAIGNIISIASIRLTTVLGAVFRSESLESAEKRIQRQQTPLKPHQTHRMPVKEAGADCTTHSPQNRKARCTHLAGDTVGRTPFKNFATTEWKHLYVVTSDSMRERPVRHETGDQSGIVFSCGQSTFWNRPFPSSRSTMDAI